MQIIDGKQTAADIRRDIADEVSAFVAKGLRAPHIAAVLVGHDGASETYVSNKVKACAQCGIECTVVRREADVSQDELLDIIASLNADPEIDGLIVQLPLPYHIDVDVVTESIHPDKDIDGFHPLNVGRAALGLPCFHSATPAGILRLLAAYNIPTEGRNCVVLGRSNIVGKPVAILMMQKGYPGNATVTVCHSLTPDIESICRNADILISAMGQPHRVKADMVKEGATVIDVGITRVDDPSAPRGYRLMGDVDFENVAEKCSYITPVPGGVGPMTIAMLINNALIAYKRNRNIYK